MLDRLKEKKSCLRPDCNSTDFIIRNIHGPIYICVHCGCIHREDRYAFNVKNPDKLLKEEKVWQV